MDHLPKPYKTNPWAPKLIVSLRCDPDGCDNGPLETYPGRRVFRLNYWGELKFANILTLPDGSRPSIEQSTKFLQESLFFGLHPATHSLYGTTFNGNDYISTSSTTTVLTLAQLSKASDIWCRLHEETLKTERKQRYHDTERHLMRVMHFLTNSFTANSQEADINIS